MSRKPKRRPSAGAAKNMAGVDRFTFRVMRDGWAHTLQSLAYLFVTRLGSRVMRRTVGAAVPALLGRNMTPPTILRWKTAIIIACELWEPRFFIRDIETLEEANTPERMRGGNFAVRIWGEYRPRGHLGDTSTDVLDRNFTIGRTSSGNVETA